MTEQHTLTASYRQWVAELRALFPVRDEFLLAEAIYPFYEDYQNRVTPLDSYERFDLFVSADA